MPVIGRLDGQVDEVLIAPLEKRRRRRDEPANDEPSDAAGHLKERAERAAHEELEKDAVRDELPVWLL